MAIPCEADSTAATSNPRRRMISREVSTPIGRMLPHAAGEAGIDIRSVDLLECAERESLCAESLFEQCDPVATPHTTAEVQSRDAVLNEPHRASPDQGCSVRVSA